MIRNLKALGLAHVAVFALSVMAASSASADTVEGASEPTYWTGEQGAVFDELKVTDGLTFCEKIKYSGKSTKGPTLRSN